MATRPVTASDFTTNFWCAPATASRGTAAHVFAIANNFFKTQSLDQLTPVQLLTLTRNVHVINEIYALYHATVVGVSSLCRNFQEIDEAALQQRVLPLFHPTTIDQINAILDQCDDYGGTVFPVATAGLVRRFLDDSVTHFHVLDAPQKLKWLCLADKMNRFNGDMRDAICILDDIYTSYADLDLDRLKPLLFKRITNREYRQEFETVREDFVELVVKWSFCRPQFPGYGVLRFAEALLADYAEHLEDFHTKAEQIVKLLISLLRVAPYGRMSRERCLPVIRELMNRGIPIWDKIPANYRAPVLQSVVGFWSWTAVGQLFFEMCKAQYATLTEQERSEFFKLLSEYDVGLRSPREIVMDFARHLAGVQPLDHDAAKRVLKRVLSYEGTLTEAEIPKLLALMNCMDLTARDTVELTRVFQTQYGLILMNYLASTHGGESCVPTYNSVAIQLCFWMAGACFLAHEETVATVLQNINVSRLSSSIFARLTGTSRKKTVLTNIFLKDPERYLTSADETQLERFFGPREAGLEVDWTHVERVKIEEMVPPLEAGVSADLSELMQMFWLINFTDNGRLDYVDPETLVHERDRYTPDELYNALDTMVTNVLAGRVTFAPTDPMEKRKFQTNLLRYLQHIVVMLREKKPEDRPGFLIHLAKSGLNCGGGYFGAAKQAYELMKGQKLEQIQLEEWLGQILEKRRDAILDAGIHNICMRKTGKVDVHAYGVALKAVGPLFGVIKSGTHQFEDDQTGDACKRPFVGAQKQGLLEELHGNCKMAYTPTVMINEVYKHFQGISGHKQAIPEEVREQANDGLAQLEKVKQSAPLQRMANWMKRQEIDRSDKGELLSQVYHPETYRIKRSRVISLLQANGILRRSLLGRMLS